MKTIVRKYRADITFIGTEEQEGQADNHMRDLLTGLETINGTVETLHVENIKRIDAVDLAVKEIVVTRRSDDYHACLKNHPEIWASGNTRMCAIGDLIASHGVTFGIGVGFTDDEKDIVERIRKENEARDLMYQQALVPGRKA
jgi:hypothetical protein